MSSSIKQKAKKIVHDREQVPPVLDEYVDPVQATHSVLALFGPVPAAPVVRRKSELAEPKSSI